MKPRDRLFTKTRIRRWLLTITALAACWILMSAAVAHRLTQRWRPAFAEPAPGVAWGPLEEVRLNTADGQ